MNVATYTYASREEWLADRKNFIGASEVASILNIPGAYGSRWDLWMKKTGRHPGVKETEGMRWGQRMEPVIAEAVREEYGGEIVRPGDQGVGPVDKPHQRATLDAYWLPDSGGPVALELKNVGEYMREEWTGDAPPAAYFVQVQWQLYCADMDRGAIAALIGGNRLVLHRIERDQELIDAMVQAVDVFWDQVKRDVEPDITAKDLPTYKYRWQEKRGETVAIPDSLAEAYALKRAEAAAADDAKAMAAYAIQQAMGEATEGVVDGATAFTWRANRNGVRTFRATKDGEQLMERLMAQESVA